MPILRQYLLAVVLGAGFAAGAWAQAAPADKDPLRAVLQESKDKNRGVTVHVKGAAINLIVVQVDDTWLVGKSNASGRIVVRVDRIDAAVASF
ncbi:MAG TPA: hypothetical protein VGE70_08590 [Burkholderiaceae bacterium]